MVQRDYEALINVLKRRPMKKTKLILVLLLLVMILSIVPKSATAQTQVVNCGTNSDIQDILDDITEQSVAKWIRDLSGENSVVIDGEKYTIKTRYTSELFNPANQYAKAYPYLTQELIKLGFVPGVTLHDHDYSFKSYAPKNLDRTIPDPEPIEIEAVGAKNLVLTIPGHGPNAHEQVLMTAHLDSTSNKPQTEAPGAEDNGSGVAALMEAARLFRYYKFDRTIKIIFFTGEEQGLYGSEAYAQDFQHESDNMLGVVNLDMFGYDADKDYCMELHVGTMPESNVVGSCFSSINSNYNLGIKIEYLTNEAIRASDHASFWDIGVGAVEILENYATHAASYGCNGVRDRNPNYHKTTDLIQHMYMPATHRIAQAGVGTVASMAGMMGKCFDGDPRLKATAQTDSIKLTWNEIPGAGAYRIYRGTRTCAGEMTLLTEVTTNSYIDTDILYDTMYFYQVQAIETDGICFSELMNCATAKVPSPEEPPVYDFYLYLPVTL